MYPCAAMSERTLSPPYRPGDLLAGRYELRAMLDQGGLSDVYLAFDRLLERQVVVKSPRLGPVADPRSLARFRREARALARLSHPGVVAVHDVSFHHPGPFLVEEYVAGTPLAHVVSALGALPPHRAAEIAADVADALAAAHERGIVHRDVKPGNIMLLPSGAVKVIDFGIAWAPWWTPPTDGPDVQGTAVYCSPEQIRGDGVDGRSDLYSLGVVLFELLAGRPPFTGETSLAIARQHLEAPPPPLPESIPAELRDIVARCLDKGREARFGSARELSARLRRVAAPTPEEVTVSFPGGQPTPPLPAEPATRNRPWRPAAIAVAVTLVAALIWSLVGTVLSAKPRAVPLRPPIGLRAEARCDGFNQYAVVLGWQRVGRPTGYLVLRRSQGDERFRRVERLRGKDRTAYVDRGLSGSTTYAYVIRSTRGSRSSRRSTPVAVTTNAFCFS